MNLIFCLGVYFSFFFELRRLPLHICLVEMEQIDSTTTTLIDSTSTLLDTTPCTRTKLLALAFLSESEQR